MSDSSPDKIAARKDRKTLPLPDAREDLDFTGAYNAVEFERIRAGLIPEEMEDKWFIFFEDPWLYFHRSWTGSCIYAVRFEKGATGFAAVESWVSRNRDEYKGTRRDYDRAMLNFLIDALLLRKPATFPVPDSIPKDAPKGIYQHHLVGRAYPETTFPAKSAAESSPHAGIVSRFKFSSTLIVAGIAMALHTALAVFLFGAAIRDPIRSGLAPVLVYMCDIPVSYGIELLRQIFHQNDDYYRALKTDCALYVVIGGVWWGFIGAVVSMFFQWLFQMRLKRRR